MVLGRHPCRWRGPRSRRRCRGAASCPSGVSPRWRSSSVACVKAGVRGGVRAKAAGRFLTSWFPCEAVRVPPLPLRRPLVGGRSRRPHPRLWGRKRAFRACVVIRISVVATYLCLRRLFSQQLANREARARAPPSCRPPSWSLLFAGWEDVAPRISGGRLADDADLSAVDSIFETALVALI